MLPLGFCPNVTYIPAGIIPPPFNVMQDIHERTIQIRGIKRLSKIVVTDQSGKVLGLEGVYSYRLVIILGPIGRIPPIISIDSAAELLLSNLAYSFLEIVRNVNATQRIFLVYSLTVLHCLYSSLYSLGV
jgi:hypothetical protein